MGLSGTASPKVPNAALFPPKPDPGSPDVAEGVTTLVDQGTTLFRDGVADSPEINRGGETVELKVIRDPGGDEVEESGAAEPQTADATHSEEQATGSELVQKGKLNVVQPSADENKGKYAMPSHESLANRASVPLPAVYQHESLSRASSMPHSGAVALEEPAEPPEGSQSDSKAIKVKKSKSLSRRVSTLFRRKDRSKARPTSGAEADAGGLEGVGLETDKPRIGQSMVGGQESEELLHPTGANHADTSGATPESSKKKRKKDAKAAASSNLTDKEGEGKTKRKGGRLFAFVRRK